VLLNQLISTTEIYATDIKLIFVTEINIIITVFVSAVNIKAYSRLPFLKYVYFFNFSNMNRLMILILISYFEKIKKIQYDKTILKFFLLPKPIFFLIFIFLFNLYFFLFRKSHYIINSNPFFLTFLLAFNE